MHVQEKQANLTHEATHGWPGDQTQYSCCEVTVSLK